MFKEVPLFPTKPTMPCPQGIRISALLFISSTVDFELTSNKLDTRYLESLPGSPWTKNKEHLEKSNDKWHKLKLELKCEFDTKKCLCIS